MPQRLVKPLVPMAIPFLVATGAAYIASLTVATIDLWTKGHHGFWFHMAVALPVMVIVFGATVIFRRRRIDSRP